MRLGPYSLFRSASRPAPAPPSRRHSRALCCWSAPADATDPQSHSRHRSDPSDPASLAYFWEHPLLAAPDRARNRECIEFLFAVTQLAKFRASIGRMDEKPVYLAYTHEGTALVLPWRAAVAFMMQNPESMLADRWSYAQFVNGRQAALAKLAGRVVCVYCTKPTLHDADEIFAHQQQMHGRKVVYANIDYWFDVNDTQTDDRPARALVPDRPLFLALRRRLE